MPERPKEVQLPDRRSIWIDAFELAVEDLLGTDVEPAQSDGEGGDHVAS